MEAKMPVPDLHTEEPKVEVSPGLYQSWREAEDNAKAWDKVARERRQALEQSLGDAHAGTVGGRLVVTYRPSEKWATAALIKAYPDLTQHYMRPKESQELDLELFRRAYPQIAEAFRVRVFRDAGS
jgi:hypothetical protein